MGDRPYNRSSFFGCRRINIGGILLAALLATSTTFSMLASEASAQASSRIFASGFESAGAAAIDSSSITPKESDRVPADARPRIGVNFTLGPQPQSSVRILVNNVDVTGDAQIDSGSVAYTPDEALPEGRQQIQVYVGDDSHAWSFWTATVPLVDSMQPFDVNLPTGAQPTISARYSDVGSGIDPQSVRLTISESEDAEPTDVTALAVVTESTIEYTLAEPMSDGVYYVELDLTDVAGNRALGQIRSVLQVGDGPELLSVEPGPNEVVLPFGAQPRITARLKPGAYPLRHFKLSFDGIDPAPATLEVLDDGTHELSYLPPGLVTGRYCFYFQAVNEIGLKDSDVRCFTIDFDRQEQVQITSPAPDAVFASEVIEVQVVATDHIGYVSRVKIAGEQARVQRDRSAATKPYLHHYNDEVRLQPGENLIEVEVEFRSGNIERRQLRVHFHPPPQVQVDAPLDWQSFGPVNPRSPVSPGGSANLTGVVQRPITVSGTTDTPVVSVEVNQQQAQVGEDGLSFVFENFFLHEGTNHISATATDAHGRSGGTSVTVFVDQTAPLLTFESPAVDAVTSLQAIDVRGVVNDAVQSSVRAPLPLVNVLNETNGEQIQATVQNLGYLAESIKLEVGTNRLTVTATDTHGSSRAMSRDVARTAVGAARLTALSGNRQQASARTELPQPLSVQATDAEGLPARGVEVRFSVLRGAGSIRAESSPTLPDGINPARNVAVGTDADGVARVWLTLGSDARPGSDEVIASRDDLAENVGFTATAVVGPAARISIYGSSGTQYVQSGGAPVDALMVQVLDAHDNPVPDAAVEFKVEEGEAYFVLSAAQGGIVSADGQTLSVSTDQNGVAASRPRTGGQAGLPHCHRQARRAQGRDAADDRRR